MRILLGYNLVYGKQIADKLAKEECVDLCFNAFGDYCNEEGKIINFNLTLGLFSRYWKVYDPNEFSVPSKELMEKIRPYYYEAIRLAERRNENPIIDFPLENIRFYEHVRFWNHIFEKYQFDMAFFEETPHVEYSYVIYLLAKIKNIPILMLGIGPLANRRVVGVNIESEGQNIGDAYHKLGMRNTLPDNYDDYWNAYCENQKRKTGIDKKQYKDNIRFYYENYFKTYSLRNILFGKPLFTLRMAKYMILEHHNMGWIRRRHQEYDELKRELYLANYYRKYKAVTIKQYNKFAKEVDLRKPYIYFSLQFTPEETTMPRAGVFMEQYQSIIMLGRIAEALNMEVYVKEHFVQLTRNKDVYEMISNIPNVHFVKMKYSQMELLEHCICAATQTGSVVFESAVNGKFCLTFSDGCMWKDMPNLVNIQSEEQGVEALREIINGREVSETEMKKYFYAIKQNTIEVAYDKDYLIKRDSAEYKASSERMVQLIKEFYKSGYVLTDCVLSV